jgi:thioredoxin 1
LQFKRNTMWTTFIILGLLLLVLAFLIIRAKRQMSELKNIKDSEKVKILTDQNFSNKTKSGLVLVDFWASWCMPCKLMVPVLNDLAEEVDGKVTIAKLNVDEAKATASKFAVRSIPTLILFKNGKELHRFVGVKTKDYLVKELDRRSAF